MELSKSSEHLAPFYCFLVGLPEHWLERQRKIQERIERVQRENEVQANRGAWKLRGPTRVTKNRGSQRNQKKFFKAPSIASRVQCLQWAFDIERPLSKP